MVQLIRPEIDSIAAEYAGIRLYSIVFPLELPEVRYSSEDRHSSP